MQGQWNAVHVNGHWRLIDVYWTTATTSTRDHNDSSSCSGQQPWTRLQVHDAADPVATADDRLADQHPGQQQQQQEQGKVFNEFFFLPDPDQFVLTHLPDEDPWQLVDRNRIWTSDKFENYLYIRERFFDLDMQMVPSSKTNCVIETVEGKTVAVFGLPSKRSKTFRFTYILYRHKSDYDPAVHSLLFERYLLFRKTSDRVELDIRFPVTGRFLLNIYGKDMERDQDFSQLCSYVIDCKTPAANVEPLPECPDIGWGPGSEIEAVGMVAKSHTKPVIRAKNGELEMEFEASDLKVALLHILSDEVDEWYGSRHGILFMQPQKKTPSLSIKLQLPKPGTYAVKLFATNLIAEGDIPNVLNYLVKYPDNANIPSSLVTSISFSSSSSSSCKPFPLIHEGIVGKQYLSTVFSVTTTSNFDFQRIVKTSDGKLDVILTNEMDEAEFLFHLNSIDLREIDLVDSCMKEVSSDRQTKLSLNLPQSGQYALNIFVRLSPRDDSIHVVQTQLIQSTQNTSLPVQEKQSNGEDKDEKDGGINARRSLLTDWCSSMVNVWKNGLRVNKTLTVYQTPVVLATAISEEFQIKIPPGDHPLVAELQKETAILFPQSHRVSKVLRKDYELFSFKVSQNGMYRIDFYECLAASGALIHLATYSITRRNPSEQEMKEVTSTTEPYEDMSTAMQHQDSAETESAVAVDDKQHRAPIVVIQKQVSKEAVIKKDEPRKSSERLKPEKSTKKKSAEKKVDKAPKTPQAIIIPTPILTKSDTSQLQNSESESKAEPKGQPKELEQPQETERKVEEPTERDVRENPPPIIIEEYKSKTSLQEDSHTPLQEDIITEPVTEKEDLTIEPEKETPENIVVVHAPLIEKAKKFIPKVFRKSEKQTDKSQSPKDLKPAKEPDSKAKQKSSAQKADEERSESCSF